MKLKYILSAVVVLLLASCEDYLELTPKTDRTETNFYKTPKDAFQALVAVYDVLQWGAPRAQNVPFELISEIASDNCHAGGANANDVPGIIDIDRHTIKATKQEADALWYKYYAGIYRANLFFEKVPAIEFEDENLKKRYLAEAAFLRANYYFDLVRLFGNVPLILKPLTPSEYGQTQATPEAVYAQIASDLTGALAALPETVRADEKGRITTWAAQSLLVRVWLYYTGYYNQPSLPKNEGSISKAEITLLVNNIIDKSGHDLMGDFANLWKVSNRNSIEGVFEVQYTNGSAWGDWNYREGSEGNQAVILWGIRDVDPKSEFDPGWSFAPVANKLVNAFDEADSRKAATLIDAQKNLIANGLTYTAGYQNTGYFNRKFAPLKANRGTSGSRELNYPNNYPLIRFADVLLMGAELNLDSDLPKAQGYYERVQKRAYGASYKSPSLTNNTAGRDLIFKERQLELALEGHRYWDLLRRGMDVTKAEIDLNNGNDDMKVTFNVTTKGLFPIPQTEISLSNNSLKQNPGYN